jgi:hypothetical protein
VSLPIVVGFRHTTSACCFSENIATHPYLLVMGICTQFPLDLSMDASGAL